MGTSLWITVVQTVGIVAVAYFTYLSRKDIRKVEIATNSMKDALVSTTAKKSFAEGVKSETDKKDRAD